MRPMTVLASALFPSLLLATLQVGCSSDDNSTTTLTPFDSGGVNVPEASSNAGSVTITVVGKGYVVSSDGIPVEAGASNPSGFIGADGGPTVDCTQGSTSGCTAPQGSTLYVYPLQGYTFAGWSGSESEAGGGFTNGDPDIQILPSTPSPLTATFVVQNNGADATPPPPPVDSGAGD